MTHQVNCYRFYFVDVHQHVGKALDIEASSDEEAGTIASTKLAEQSAYPGIEVWQQARRVSSVELPASAATWWTNFRAKPRSGSDR